MWYESMRIKASTSLKMNIFFSHVSAMQITGLYHQVMLVQDLYISYLGVDSTFVCVSQSEMFTSRVKKEEEPGSSLTRALSHGGAASVHTGYFKTFSPQRGHLFS